MNGGQFRACYQRTHVRMRVCVNACARSCLKSSRVRGKEPKEAKDQERRFEERRQILAKDLLA